MFQGMKYWQKGALYSLAFVLAVSVIYAGIMVFFEYAIEKKGSIHLCSGLRFCSVEEAISERLAIIPAMLVFFGIPVAIFASLAGVVMDRLFPK